MRRPRTLQEAIMSCDQNIRRRLVMVEVALETGMRKEAMDVLSALYESTARGDYEQHDLELLGRFYERVGKNFDENHIARGYCLRRAISLYSQANKPERSGFIKRHYKWVLNPR